MTYTEAIIYNKKNGWPMTIRFLVVAGGGFEPPTSGL